MEQQHLNYADRVNLGGYYTPSDYVDIAWEMVRPHIDPDTVIVDSACGYGNFLKHARQNITIGCDLDKTAIDIAEQHIDHAHFLHANALQNVGRSKFHIPETAKLVMVGNPPYNDRTSIIRNAIKHVRFTIDRDIASRDLGMSFLLSYDKLKADFVCVLHPLSYLIKRANFNLLRQFTSNYRLLDGFLISSGVFAESSKSMQFPILIALYRRDSRGMHYDFIRQFRFKTSDKIDFSLNDFDYITRYIDKYPSKHRPKIDGDSIFFWTMRDINALKRNRTFVKNYSYNTIVIDKNKLDYYAYVDVFKRNTSRVPFYFGNCDVLIDHQLFRQYRGYFLTNALTHHRFLSGHIEAQHPKEHVEAKIEEYFSHLLSTSIMRS